MNLKAWLRAHVGRIGRLSGCTRRVQGLHVRARRGWRRWADERGGVLVITAISMVTISGMAALATDAGAVMISQQRLQSAVDAAALAGASAFPQGATTAAQAQQNAQTAASMAVQYAQKNHAGASYTATADASADTVDVTASEPFQLWFGQVLGIQTKNIQAHARTQVGTLGSGVGMVPITVTNQVFQYGQQVQLSSSSGTGSSGNYGFLDFSGNGAKGLEIDLQNGFTFPLSVGEQVTSEPGVMTGDVKQAIDARLGAAQSNSVCSSLSTATDACTNVMYIPVVDSLPTGGSSQVTILGFAAFYLEGLAESGGHQVILGQFIHIVRAGTLIPGTNYGTYTVKIDET